MKHALSILRFLRDRARLDDCVVLVTLTDVTGSAARAPGEHMAVAESGAVLGSFSGGCIEAAVVAEAREVLAEGRSRHVRYGAGSPYIDIRLPCGGGIDLLFLPDPDPRQIERALGILEARRAVTLDLLSDGNLMVSEAGAEITGWNDEVFRIRHDPSLRLVIMGHGAEPGALLGIAEAYGAETLLLSPQITLVEEARRKGSPAEALRVIGRSDGLTVDPWTAVIALFHDHDWEIELLLQALEQQPLFVGAMGSRKTHAERRHRLIDAGGDPGLIDRIVGPVGLIHASRDPQTLAVSVMAQVVQAYEAMLTRTARRPASAEEKVMSFSHRFDEAHARGNTSLEALQS